MSIFDLASPPPAVIDCTPRRETAVIGLIAENEFQSARSAIPELARNCDYNDWLDAREGLQIGLAMAGVDASIVEVTLASFLQWSRLTGAPADERSLDAFAGLVAAARNSPDLRVLALVDELDFAKHFSAIGALAAHGDYDRWRQHRCAMRADAIASWLHIQQMPIRLEGFLAWCACLGQSASEAALDRYAQLLLEHLTCDLAA